MLTLVEIHSATSQIKVVESIFCLLNPNFRYLGVPLSVYIRNAERTKRFSSVEIRVTRRRPTQ